MNNLPRQGQRIVWLVRSLTATGLLMVVITVGLLGGTLSAMRKHRAQLAQAEDELKQSSERLSQGAWESRGEIMGILGDETFATDGQHSIIDLGKYVHHELVAQADPLAQAALLKLQTLTADLVALRERAVAWRAGYDIVRADFDSERTIGQVRSLITQLRGAMDAAQGHRRLEEAIQYRRWRAARGEEAQRQATALLEAHEKQESRKFDELDHELDELAVLVELLGGEQQTDHLADLKENQIKPLLDRLSSASVNLDITGTETGASMAQAIEQLRVAILGGSGHGNPAGQHGLFALRREALQLDGERQKLTEEAVIVRHDIDAAIATFAQAAQARTTELAREMERGLAVGWRRLILVGSGCALLFLWLAWIIARRIHGQVQALERARAESEADRQTTRQLMLDQFAAATELAVAHQSLRDSEQRFRLLSASAPIGIFQNDAQGGCLYCNPEWERIAGIAAADSLGDGWRRAIHPEDQARAHAEWLRTAESASWLR